MGLLGIASCRLLGNSSQIGFKVDRQHPHQDLDGVVEGRDQTPVMSNDRFLLLWAEQLIVDAANFQHGAKLVTWRRKGQRALPPPRCGRAMQTQYVAVDDALKMEELLLDAAHAGWAPHRSVLREDRLCR